MLTINASTLRANLNDAVATPAPSGDSSSDPAGFSSLLRQSQAAAPMTPAVAAMKVNAPAARNDAVARAPDRTPDSEPTTTADHDTATPAEADEAATSTAASHARAQPKPKGRAGDAAAHAAKPASDAADSATKSADKTTADSATAKTPTAQLDPNIAQWLAALQRPAADAKANDRTQATADAATSTLGDAPVSAKGARAGDTAIGADPKDKAGLDTARFAAVAADAASLEAARVESHTTEIATAPTPHAPGKADGVLAASLQPTPTALNEAAAPVSVAIATPVNAPDFAQTLGMQMSVLTKDGVQQAELHLNPAEMGPVSVQIVMDGTQARIDFGADTAATRHAIEAGLPELASALRDAGFTLAGGGVSQHSSSRRDSGDADGSESRRSGRAVSSDSVARVSTAARRVVTNGGVDLYA
jgi:flagellar hook-length control protein FliK